MPTITIYRKPKFISDMTVVTLSAKLRQEVARLLNTIEPGGMLTPEQIEVRITDGHPLDANTCDLSVGISAKYSDDRYTDVNSTVDDLVELIRSHVSATVDDPPRRTDTWLEIELNAKFGRPIWP